MSVKEISKKELPEYGYFLGGDYSLPLTFLKEGTEGGKPDGSNLYVADDVRFHGFHEFEKPFEEVFGTSPMEIGYCNGHNRKLNCLEYHASPEVDIPAQDVILLLALQKDIVDGKLDTSKVKALRVKAGEAFVLHPYTLHFSPCETSNDGFQCLILLPQGTNADLDSNVRDRKLWKKNKWLLAHEESEQAELGAYVGLSGANIEVVPDEL